jgi:hypothetical protein
VNLPGILAATTLGDLLGRLYRGGVNGVLELVEREGHRAGRSHRIHFERGLIDEVETELDVPRLGEVLVEEGAIDRVEIGRVQRQLEALPPSPRRPERLGEALVNEDLVSSEAVRRALHRQLGMRLDALFDLGDALVRFHVRRNAQKRSGHPDPLTAREFLDGRPRKRGSAASLFRGPNRGERAAFELLGIEPTADRGRIRQAFRKRAADLHPDRHPHASPERKTELLGRFAELSRAYHAVLQR